jgi:hypothetical protein
VGPRAGLDGCGKFGPLPRFDNQTVQLVASRYTDLIFRQYQYQIRVQRCYTDWQLSAVKCMMTGGF